MVEVIPDPAAPTVKRRWFSGALWDNRDFARLWWAQSVSQIGSQISVVAIPLIAIQTLGVGPQGMGLLQALSRLPFLLYLFAGVWVDRTARRPVLIATDIGRGALLLSLVIGGITHTLSLWLLAVVITASMTLSVWFETAYMSLLPSFVDREHLMAANTRLETSRSGAQAVGPALGGAMVQLLTAPVAVAIDAVSFGASALFVGRMRVAEPRATRESLKVRGILAELGDGLRHIFGHELLRPLLIAIAISNLVWASELSLYFIFLVNTVGLTASLIGLTLAAAGPGAVVGSLLASWIRTRFGPATAIIGGLTIFACAAQLIPLAVENTVLAVTMLMVAGFLMAAGGQICAVNVLTLRQSVTPNELQGRVNASFRFFALGISPVGALAGGFIGSHLGLRAAMFVSVLGMFLAPLVLLTTPVRRAGRGESS